MVSSRALTAHRPPTPTVPRVEWRNFLNVVYRVYELINLPCFPLLLSHLSQFIATATPAEYLQK